MAPTGTAAGLYQTRHFPQAAGVKGCSELDMASTCHNSKEGRLAPACPALVVCPWSVLLRQTWDVRSQQSWCWR